MFSHHWGGGNHRVIARDEIEALHVIRHERERPKHREPKPPVPVTLSKLQWGAK
jgi:hypothetical protein